jgi:hypothetical protein
VSFKPSSEQQQIATAFTENAELLGDADTVRQFHDAAGKRFKQSRIGQLVAQVAATQSEFGRGVVEEFLGGRFSVATALTRSLLETAAWIAWPFSVPDEEAQKARLIRLLLQGYRDAQNRGLSIPPDAADLLKTTTGKAARKPVDFQQMLKDLDALERKTPGGKEFWVSHAANFDVGSDHVHPSFYGAATGLEAANGNEVLGVNALVHGHQYLALSAAACAIAAELPDLKAAVESRYARVAELQRAQLERLTS